MYSWEPLRFPGAWIDSLVGKAPVETSPSVAFEPSTELAKIVASTPSHERVAIAGFRGGRPNWRYAPEEIPRGAENYYPFRGVNDFSNFKTGHFARVVNVANGHAPEFRWGRHSSPAPIKLSKYDTALPDYFGIRYLVTNAENPKEVAPGYFERHTQDDGTMLLENPAPLPFAYLVEKPAVVKDLATGLAALAGPRAGTVGGFTIGEPSVPGTPLPLQPDEVQLVNSASGHVFLRTAASSAGGLLVVQEGFARGWSAVVDGENADVVLANGMWCGVWVPAGSHEVKLSFRTRGFELTWALFAIGWLVALLPFLMRSRWRRWLGGSVTA